MENNKLDIWMSKIITKIDYDEEQESTQSSPNQIHKTVKVCHFTGIEVDIDEGIAELVAYLWKFKIDTFMSCESNGPNNHIWIKFVGVQDLMHFLSILVVGLKNSDPILNRIFEKKTNDKWIYRFHIIPDIDCHSIIQRFFLPVSVHFPRSDYQWVCQRFKQKLEN